MKFTTYLNRTELPTGFFISMSSGGLTAEDLLRFEEEQQERKAEQLEAMATRTENMIRNGKRIDRTNHRFLFFIHGNAPLTNRDDMTALANLFCKNKKDILYVEIGNPEQGRNGTYHQHCLIVLKENYRFCKRPVFTSADGTVYTINFTNENGYSKATGDLNYYLKYMRKGSNEPDKPYLHVDHGFLNPETGDQKKDDKKPSYDHDLNTAALMDNLQDAVNYLRDRHPARFIKDEGNFKRIWYGKHMDELTRKQYYRDDLFPFKTDEECKAIRLINNFVREVIYHPMKRMGNLFVVGPSKMGKSEYIIQNVFLKYPCFLMKGDFDFTGYDEEKDYKFIIFDDVNYMRADNLERIRSLTSSINASVLINIKYGTRIVKSRPIIHLINEHQYQNIRLTISRAGSGDWWHDNMHTVKVTEPLFTIPPKKKMEQVTEQEKQQDDDLTVTINLQSQLELPKTPNMSQAQQELPSRPATPGLPEERKKPIEQKEPDIEELMAANGKMPINELEEKSPRPPKSSKAEDKIRRKRKTLAWFNSFLTDDVYDKVLEQWEQREKELEAEGEHDSYMDESTTIDEEFMQQEMEDFQRETEERFDNIQEENEQTVEKRRQAVYDAKQHKFRKETDREYHDRELDEMEYRPINDIPFGRYDNMGRLMYDDQGREIQYD